MVNTDFMKKIVSTFLVIVGFSAFASLTFMSASVAIAPSISTARMLKAGIIVFVISFAVLLIATIKYAATASDQQEENIY